MRKILVFNGYYYPSRNYGGPITSIENVINACSDEYDFYVACYDHDFNDMTPFRKEKGIWHQVGKAKVQYFEQGELDFSKVKMRAFLKTLSPDLIWFSGILTPNNKIVAVRCARLLNIPVLFSPRGEVSADRVVLKGWKKRPYLFLLKFFNIYKDCFFHGTSDDEIDGLKKYFNPDKQHLFEIPNIAITQQPELVKHQKVSGTLHAMFFSRIHEVKNILYAVQAISKCKHNIIYDVYGPIESEAYWNECVKVAENAGPNIILNYCGILSKAELSKVIQEHDCFIFPTINENYGHAIAESLANSRPVILSKGTTPWDDLDGEAGYVIPLDNPLEFTEKIDYLASLNQDEYQELIKTTAYYFTKKIGENVAVERHKKMFEVICRRYE